MAKKIMLSIMLVGFTSWLVACNTVHGVGKDTERAGEKIQDTADRNR